MHQKTVRSIEEVRMQANETETGTVVDGTEKWI